MTDLTDLTTRLPLPPSTPINKQIEALLSKIETLQKRIATLEEPTPEETAQEKADREREEREERKRRSAELRAEAAAAELAKARAEAIRAIAKLLPEAIAQARGVPARRGKPAQPPRPALLRLILRATR